MKKLIKNRQTGDESIKKWGICLESALSFLNTPQPISGQLCLLALDH